MPVPNLVHDDNLVCILNRGEAVCDYNGGTVTLRGDGGDIISGDGGNVMYEMRGVEFRVSLPIDLCRINLIHALIQTRHATANVPTKLPAPYLQALHSQSPMRCKSARHDFGYFMDRLGEWMEG